MIINTALSKIEKGNFKEYVRDKQIRLKITNIRIALSLRGA